MSIPLQPPAGGVTGPNSRHVLIRAGMEHRYVTVNAITLWLLMEVLSVQEIRVKLDCVALWVAQVL